MNPRLLFALLLILLPCFLRAQSVAPVRNGDTIDLNLTGVPPDDSSAFNHTYTIDDDGMINLPYIQKVKVGGLLPNQIQDLIQTRYVEAKIYTHPTVTVQQNAVPRYVNIGGHVKNSTRVPYTSDLTLMSTINAAGGFDDFADKKKVELLRGGKRTIYNTEDIRKGHSEDPKVMPGDQINVPQSFF